MDTLLEWFHQLRNPTYLVQAAGFIGLVTIIFVETGFFFGFFLPGDSLLVTAGLLIATGLDRNVYVLGLALNVAAVLGDAVNYWFGRVTGPKIFVRDDSLFFKKKHVERAHEFYVKHGAKTIVLARFMPIVRTFAPLVAGVAKMDYRVFAIYNVIGGTAWIWSMLFTGYFLGRYVPGIDKYIELVIIIVIFLSILPGIVAWWRERRRQKRQPEASEAADD
jgi:membrane-associated protein